MFPYFLWLGNRDTKFARVELVQAVSESAFDFLSGDLPSFARAGRASVHTPRCSNQCSPPTTLAEDLAPISASKQPARVLRGPEAPSRC